ncbi:hypothetical protein V6N13_091566 [Hibiscus sabdariffa]
MGGKVFLLSFEDEDLYIMLEDLEWSYLKEIFFKMEECLGGERKLVLNSEIATILITMGYSRRIDEMVLVEIGSETHEINILELGFKHDIVDPLTQATNVKAPMKPQSEDSSKSCLEHE